MNALVPTATLSRNLIDSIEVDIREALPKTIPFERFKATFLTAVAHNPDILKCQPQSIKTALMKCAVDHLMPDGREAALAPYNTKVKNDEGKEVWASVAQYMPMVQGIRKRALELSGARISAECVYEADEFDCDMGDNPYIRHKPAPLMKSRGVVIGAYAIFRDDNDKILHRELLPLEDIERARSVSRASNGPGWTKFYGEMARKTAVRRGSKSVPSLPDELRRIIERDDEMVDLSGAARVVDSRNANPLLDERPTRLTHSGSVTALLESRGIAINQVPLDIDVSSPHAVEAWLASQAEAEDTSAARDAGVTVTSGPATAAASGATAAEAMADKLRRYSSALLNKANPAELKTASSEFWDANGGRPSGADGDAAQSIFNAHKDFLAGKFDEDALNAVVREVTA